MLLLPIVDMNFGQKLRKIREGKGISQERIAEALGYVSNSYISRVEKGDFLPSEENLKKIAKVLAFPFEELKSFWFEEKIRELGIKKPELIALFRDIPNLPEKEKRAIIEAYLKVKERMKKVRKIT